MFSYTFLTFFGMKFMFLLFSFPFFMQYHISATELANQNFFAGVRYICQIMSKIILKLYQIMITFGLTLATNLIHVFLSNSN